MSKRKDDIFATIAYWFRVGQMGVTKGGGGVKKTLRWKRDYNADSRKAEKEIDKAF